MKRLLQFIFLLQLLFLTVQSYYYNGSYFDPKNLTYAECVPKGKVYAYYGTKNKALNGRDCIKWNTVRLELSQIMKDYSQYYFSTEYEDHNHCRSIVLSQYERDPKVNNASQHSFIEFEEWKRGPWCYVKNLPSEAPVKLWFGKFTSNYRPWPCFEYCSEHPDPITTKAPEITTTPAIKEVDYYNYNDDLIEQLSDKLFSGFNSGDATYYTKAEHRDKLSLRFQIRRHYIFFAFLSILIIAVSISIGTYVWRRYGYVRRILCKLNCCSGSRQAHQ
ncbi:hypothetical protein M3Y97_00476600 [Aphelenchoides bicaudatus]|nr:hypothetical protein M3Y97_00476600 [Aphelenchoides bicaudatus]